MAPDRGKSTAKQTASRAWDALTPPLSEWLLDATSSMGFLKMTPVQAETIPLFMAYKDVVVEAVTGSGKTLAFLIPIIEKLLRNEAPLPKHHVGAIIISPTRELASQIYQVLLSLLAFHGPSAAATRPSGTAHGLGTGETKEEQESERHSRDTLKVVPQLLVGGSTTPAQDLSQFLKASPNLLVSTPGRLLEILASPFVLCPQSSFEILVLDEADRLLDLGFKDDLSKILARLPKQRRTGLFSASVSEAVDQIIRVGLRNPVRISVKVRGINGTEDRRTPASLAMTYVLTSPSQKFPALSNLLYKANPTPLKTIVYLSTCAAVDYFQFLLPPLLPPDILLIPLHGKHPSTVRQKNFIRFTNSASSALLLTTDVAARGLDIPAVDLVVQVDPPSDPKVFLHRCGRAGRAGRKGLSVIFLQPGREEDYVAFLSVRKTPIQKLTNPDITATDSQVKEISSTFRSIVLTDRAHYDRAQRSFVSWVRSYSKHQASSIFRVADLDWADLGEAWGLLKMPRMPELKGWAGATKLNQQLSVDWDNYVYKDKAREKARRQAMLESTRIEITANEKNDVAPTPTRGTSSSTAWSHNAERKADREMRRAKKLARREFDRAAKMTPAEKETAAETARMVEAVRIRQQKLRQQQEQQRQGDDTLNADEFEGFD